MIDEDGKTYDIEIIDHSGREKYVDATVRHIAQLEYEPAIVDGKSVKSHQTMFVKHGIRGYGISEDSVTPGFMKKYQKAFDLLSTEQPNLAKASELITEIRDSNAKSLKEHSLLAWLESAYYFHAGDFNDYLRKSAIVVRLGEYVPVNILSKALTNLYQSQLHFGLYPQARDTVQVMASTKNINLSDDIKAEFLAQIDSLEAAQEYNTKAKLFGLGSTLYQVKGSEFNLANIEGEVEGLEVRCLGHQASYQTGWDEMIAIPDSVSNCSLLIKGAPDTTFDLIQKS